MSEEDKSKIHGKSYSKVLQDLNSFFLFIQKLNGVLGLSPKMVSFGVCQN